MVQISSFVNYYYWHDTGVTMAGWSILYMPFKKHRTEYLL
jgi:hypothetical protein